MQKQIIKAGFFEPGLVEASRFACFQPYQRTEFCLLAAEAGIDAPSVAEMMRVDARDISAAMVQRHLHNPFNSAIAAGEVVKDSLSTGKRNRLAILSHLRSSRDSTVTTSFVNLSRATGVRRGSLDGAMKRLQEKGHVEVLRRGVAGNPSTYRLTEKGVKALAKLEEDA